MTFDSADDVARKVEDVNKENGAFAAYSALKKDYDAFASGHGQAQSGAYLDAVTQQLPDLDKLAVVWAEKNRDAISRDGAITRFDLDTAADHGRGSAFDQVMVNSLKKQYDSLKETSWDPQGGFLLIGSHEKDAITKDDIDKRLRQTETERKEAREADRKHAEAQSFAGPLLQNGDDFFKRIAGKDGDGDSISWWDLKKIRKADDREREKGSQLLTDDERQLVDRLYKKWNRDPVERLKDTPEAQPGEQRPDGKITMESLALACGFSNSAQMHDSLVKPEAAPEPLPQETKQEAPPPPPKVVESSPPEVDPIAQARLAAEQQYRSALEEQSRYTVKPGQGFDRIARDVLRAENGQRPAEQDVVHASRHIAHLNGFNRETYNPKKHSIQPGQVIEVHSQAWREEQMQKAMQQFMSTEAELRKRAAAMNQPQPAAEQMEQGQKTEN